jgi:hypothetical protein
MTVPISEKMVCPLSKNNPTPATSRMMRTTLMIWDVFRKLPQ